MITISYFTLYYKFYQVTTKSKLDKYDFSYSHYKKSLLEIKKGHKISNFDDYSKNDVILRHDVDFALEPALRMAQIEKELGVQSAYFILFHAPLYNPFSLRSSQIINQVLKLGHNIGLHYDSSFILENDLDPTDAVNLEIKLMEQHFKCTIKVISAHNPSTNKKLKLKLPADIIDADSSEFRRNRKYLW